MATQEIKGRDYAGKRFNVYRARVPDSWIRRDPLPNESLSDTTKAICEYIIQGKDGLVRIAIHNFPTDTLEQRVAPLAQVARWQRQFSDLAPTDYVITPQAYNGYAGLFFKGSGQQNGVDVTVLGWSLILATEHYRMLSDTRDDSQRPLLREMRADVTIKAFGPPSLVEVHEEAITQFARSFELIEEIPSRS